MSIQNIKNQAGGFDLGSDTIISGDLACDNLVCDSLELATNVQTAPLTFSGPWAADQTVQVEYRTVGNVTTLFIPNVDAVCANNQRIDTNGTANPTLPVGARPKVLTTVQNPIIKTDLGVSGFGSMSIGNDGRIQIGNGASILNAFTIGAGGAGFLRITVSYLSS